MSQRVQWEAAAQATGKAAGRSIGTHTHVRIAAKFNVSSLVEERETPRSEQDSCRLY